ncbi:hypothetical protein Tco_1470787, partial [Tanacetum coccineum]
YLLVLAWMGRCVDIEGLRLGNYGTCRGLLRLSPPIRLASMASIDFKLRSFPPRKVDIEEDLAMLFGVEDDSSGDDFEGPEGDEEVWEGDEEWLMTHVTPPLWMLFGVEDDSSGDDFEGPEGDE